MAVGVVVFGVMGGVGAALDLAPAESRRLGVARVASAVGGLAMVAGMVPPTDRLRGLSSATGVAPRSARHSRNVSSRKRSVFAQASFVASGRKLSPLGFAKACGAPS